MIKCVEKESQEQKIVYEPSSGLRDFSSSMGSDGMCRPVSESTHIPTRLKGVRSRLAGSRVIVCAAVASVAHIAVLVSYEPQEMETESQQGGAQQITQSGQVRDGKTVWVFAAPPHGVHHPVCNTQQQQHLKHSSSQVDRHKDGCQGCVAALHQVDGVEED